MHQMQTLQGEYLAQLIKRQKPVTLYFKNGCKLIGVLMGMTDEVIFFNHGITDYFYKNNIHSIMPISPHLAKA